MKSALAPPPPFPRAAFFGGLAAFVLLSLLFQFVDWDRQAALHYFDQTPAWPGQRWVWADLLYRFGEPPAVIVGALGGLGFAVSFASDRFRGWRGPGLFLFVLLLLGPGLLVNGLGKALAGRPRPFETLGFGGLWGFAPPFHFGTAGRGLSFLSGHAASAWYFLGLLFLLKGFWRGLALVGALSFGAAMSLARVAQGAHWVSDTVLAGAAIFTLAAALSPLIHWQPPRRFWEQPKLRWALALAALAWLSLSHVRYQDRRYIVELQAAEAQARPRAPQERVLTWSGAVAPNELALELRLQASDLRISFGETAQPPRLPLRFDAWSQGQGLPGGRESLDAAILPPGDPGLPVGPRTLAYRIEQGLSGLWLTFRGGAELGLPADWPVDLRLQMPRGALRIGPLPEGRRVLLSRLPAGTDLPPGFHPYANRAWLREGADPLIAVDIQARSVSFEEQP
jgi:membrane-associated PAP2 superfamily phosphatase